MTKDERRATKEGTKRIKLKGLKKDADFMNQKLTMERYDAIYRYTLISELIQYDQLKHKNIFCNDIYFLQIGWADWILAPPGLRLNYCAGTCNFPFPEQMNASNHAIIQSLTHGATAQIPPPCCVPVELIPAELLAITGDDSKTEVVLKSYPDMEIKACGCRQCFVELR